MKKLLIGTNNESKYNIFVEMLKDYDIEVLKPSDLNIKIKVVENGNTAVENALIKAKAFYEISKIATLSADTALIITDFMLDDPRQPLTRVRRPLKIKNELSDEEVINYYSNLAKSNGGKLTAYYPEAHVLIDKSGKINILDSSKFDKKQIALESFYIVDKPHEKKVKYFPLASLKVIKEINKYHLDITDEDRLNNPLLKQRNENTKKYIEKVKNFIINNLD